MAEACRSPRPDRVTDREPLVMPNRRRLLQMLGAVAAAGAGGWALLSGGRANAYYGGPASDHFDGVRFFNPGGARPRGPGAFLKWQLGDRGEAWPRSFPSPFPADRPPARFEGEGMRIVYVGHATFLMQARGKNVLIDPVWADRASPSVFRGAEAGEPSGHRLRSTCRHRCRARHPQPLRSYGRGYDRTALAALSPRASSRRSATTRS